MKRLVTYKRRFAFLPSLASEGRGAWKATKWMKNNRRGGKRPSHYLVRSRSRSWFSIGFPPSRRTAGAESEQLKRMLLVKGKQASRAGRHNVPVKIPRQRCRSCEVFLGHRWTEKQTWFDSAVLLFVSMAVAIRCKCIVTSVTVASLQSMCDVQDFVRFIIAPCANVCTDWEELPRMAGAPLHVKLASFRQKQWRFSEKRWHSDMIPENLWSMHSARKATKGQASSKILRISDQILYMAHAGARQMAQWFASAYLRYQI